MVFVAVVRTVDGLVTLWLGDGGFAVVGSVVTGSGDGGSDSEGVGETHSVGQSVGHSVGHSVGQVEGSPLGSGDGQTAVGVGVGVGDVDVGDGVGVGVTVTVTVGEGVVPPVGVGTGTGITVGPVLGSGVASVGSGAGFFFVVGALGFGARLVAPLPGAVVAPVPGFSAPVLDCDGMVVTLTDGEALGVSTDGAMGGTVFWPYVTVTVTCTSGPVVRLETAPGGATTTPATTHAAAASHALAARAIVFPPTAPGTWSWPTRAAGDPSPSASNVLRWTDSPVPDQATVAVPSAIDTTTAGTIMPQPPASVPSRRHHR